eukprot:sb/3471645/
MTTPTTPDGPLPLSSRRLHTETDVDELMERLLLVSDIELVVISTKHVEILIAQHFPPPGVISKKMPAGEKIKKSSLDPQFKQFVTKHMFYQRNSLVHIPGEDEFSCGDTRDAYVTISTNVLKDMLRMARSNVERDGPSETSSVSSEMSIDMVRCSELLIASSPSLRDLIEEDPEGLLSED